MPLYRCHTPVDALSDEQRSAMAKAITEIHCSETTAPPTFVHVQFHDAPAGQATPFAIHGGLRAGRPRDVTDRIVKRATEAVADIAGIPVDDVAMRTSETPASWIFEGGRVLPEPGDEAAWLADG
ncbi:MAG: tautomerase family protein [Actinomycetota bacterium]